MVREVDDRAMSGEDPAEAIRAGRQEVPRRAPDRGVFAAGHSGHREGGDLGGVVSRRSSRRDRGTFRGSL